MAEYNENHRLLKGGSTGVWRVRLQNIKDPDPRKVSHTITVSLKTKDIAEARERRDIVIAALDKCEQLNRRNPLWIAEENHA